MPIFYLSDKIQFPPPYLAEKGGLLAVGGDLCMERLLSAYQQGIFPWYSEGDPILWWSPDPRLVLFPKDLKVAKSLLKTIKQEKFNITADTCFEKVISACSDDRFRKSRGTWLVDDMKNAYCRLHQIGYAHSVEAWHENKLAGGLYGVAIGKCFFGESMFTRISNASKVALVKLVEFLVENGFDMIDCQMTTPHLIRFGAREIPRALFLSQLHISLSANTLKGPWRLTDIKTAHGEEAEP